ncbi:uncharacterized protein SOCE26_004650 [Sorangium cellulosum]|uniref:Secreted protein n=1 Tax=Sorangium cellulosum TaxID=56 RepID=A0A2L0EIF3_SORCE|nr:hypothetical protein [Sorangium cellulosum]AUX39083.1 uncharacterized protein SOCE26_004650 [Sorangium cellulosum]
MTQRMPLLLVSIVVLACSPRSRTFTESTGGAADPSGGAGGAGGAGGTSGGGAEGAGDSCTVLSDCPAPAEPCQTSACVEGTCAVVPLPEGIEVAPEAGDCRRLVCDGDGAQVVLAADEPKDDGNPCTHDICQETMPAHPPRTGETCPGGVCDAGGRCVPSMCTGDLDCGVSTECYRYTCQGGLCMEGPVPAGTLCNALQDQCDEAGNCVDCFNSGGCGECCVCVSFTCVPA